MAALNSQNPFAEVLPFHSFVNDTQDNSRKKMLEKMKFE